MDADLLAALAPQKEAVTFAGRAFFAHELDCAADVPSEGGAVEMSLRLIVLCVRDAEGRPAFTDDDLAALRKASRRRIKPLIDAVMRVNGFNIEAEVKNSDAGPGSG